MNEARRSVRVESRYEVIAKKIEKYDYVDLATDRSVDLERARRFIECKLLDFVKDYTR